MRLRLRLCLCLIGNKRKHVPKHMHKRKYICIGERACSRVFAYAHAYTEIRMPVRI